jgi:hypothetical protein
MAQLCRDTRARCRQSHFLAGRASQDYSGARHSAYVALPPKHDATNQADDTEEQEWDIEGRPAEGRLKRCEQENQAGDRKTARNNRTLPSFHRAPLLLVCTQQYPNQGRRSLKKPLADRVTPNVSWFQPRGAFTCRSQRREHVTPNKARKRRASERHRVGC